MNDRNKADATACERALKIYATVMAKIRVLKDQEIFTQVEFAAIALAIGVTTVVNDLWASDEIDGLSHTEILNRAEVVAQGYLLNRRKG